MITANDLRQGTTIDLDGELYSVEEFNHVKRGRGGAFVRTRLKNLQSGDTLRKVFPPQEKIQDAFISSVPAQFLYQDGDNYHFMEQNTFEERIISRELLGEKAGFLPPNVEVSLSVYRERVIGVELPSAVDLTVRRADPGLKGDTAGSATKPVTLESGYTLRVPLFINEGDVVKVDTRTGEYLGKGSQ